MEESTITQLSALIYGEIMKSKSTHTFVKCCNLPFIMKSKVYAFIQLISFLPSSNINNTCITLNNFKDFSGNI